MSGTFTKPSGPRPNAGDAGQSELERINQALDEALMETFPASDPVAINITFVNRSASASPLKHLY